MDNEDARESIDIETPYVTLRFPKEWSKQIRTKKVKDDVYTVEFYGIVADKGEQRLFDLVFGGTEGYLLGYLDILGEDKPMTLNIISYELNATERWTEKETQLFYAMQDDVNFVIDKLVDTGDFRIAN
jgi:hypothetical protein